MKPLGLNRITPSMLGQYESCPLLFYYSSWLGIKLPQPAVHFIFGTAIHNAIAIMWQPVKTLANLNKAIESFTAEFTLSAVEANTEAERIQKYGEMLADGKLMLTELFGLLPKFESVDMIIPEKFELPWKEILSNPDTKLEPLEVPLSCRIDCVAKDNVIIEFKTSATEYDIFETRASPQPLSYAWIYLQKYGVIPTIHYIVLIKKKKRNKVQHLKIKYDMADLLMFDAKVRSIIESIKNKQFNRPLKGHTFWCECVKYERALKY